MTFSKDSPCNGKYDKYELSTQFLGKMHEFSHSWRNFNPKAPIRKNDFFLLTMVIHLSQKNDSKVTVSMLAKAMHQSMPSISQKINATEQAGYIERVGDKTDRRITYIQLTPKGEEVAEKSLQDFFDRFEKALQEVGEEKVKMLMETMNEVSDAFSRASV